MTRRAVLIGLRWFAAAALFLLAAPLAVIALLLACTVVTCWLHVVDLTRPEWGGAWQSLKTKKRGAAGEAAGGDAVRDAPPPAAVVSVAPGVYRTAEELDLAIEEAMEKVRH